MHLISILVYSINFIGYTHELEIFKYYYLIFVEIRIYFINSIMLAILIK